MVVVDPGSLLNVKHKNLWIIIYGQGYLGHIIIYGQGYLGHIIIYGQGYLGHIKLLRRPLNSSILKIWRLNFQAFGPNSVTSARLPVFSIKLWLPVEF